MQSWHAAFLYIRNHVCIGVSQERSLTHSKQKTQQREEEHFTSKTVQGGRWSSSFVSTWMVRLIKHLKLTGWDSNIITKLASMPRQLVSACLPPRHSLNNDQRQIVWAEPQVTSRAEDVLCWDGRLLKAEETVWLARFVRTRHSLNKHTLDTQITTEISNWPRWCCGSRTASLKPAGPVNHCTGSCKQTGKPAWNVFVPVLAPTRGRHISKKEKKNVLIHFFGFRCCAEPWNQSSYQTSPVIYCSSTVQWGHNISVTECGSALSQDVKIVTSSLSKQQFSTDVVKKLNKGLSPRVCLHCLFWATGLHTISLDAHFFIYPVST